MRQARGWHPLVTGIPFRDARAPRNEREVSREAAHARAL
ncbi:hypothetical protein ABIC75_000130 [Dyella japonica]|uniref:Uncharacterized protein n=1 Tax=Dyella japonica TaxID=231455 RepID=A0ABV2JNL4_9GAMM